MSSKREPIRLAGVELSRFNHVCAFFHTLDEEYGVLIPFIKEGIERGEKAFHIVNPELRDEHMRRLQEAGIPVVEAQHRGQLEVRDWDETFLREGHFNPEAMLAFIEDVLRRGKSEGYPLTRLVAQMAWLPQDRPGVNDMVEYEARLNRLLDKYDDPVICTYDVARFGAGVVLDVLRTHPVAIIGGIVHENPFCVAPDDLLRELRERGSSSSGS